MNKTEFFEKEIEILRKLCGSCFEMYDTEMSTVSETTVIADCWFNHGTTKRILVDIKNEKIFVLESFKESRNDFLDRLC